MELIKTIFEFKTVDNKSILKLLLAYKNEIPLSHNELSNLKKKL